MNANFHNGEADEPLIPNWAYRLAARWKLFVLLTIALAALIYVAIHGFAYKYESKGFVLLRRDVSLYNAQRQAFYDGALLRHYLASKNKLDTPEGKFLSQSLDSGFINKHLTLSMPYGKDDARYVGDKDRSALISTGLDLTMQSRTSGEQAAARMQLLAGFVVDAMLKQTLTSELRNKLMAARSQKQSLDNQLIDSELNLRDMTTRLNELRQIASRYPEAAKMNERQLLTTSGDSGRFLSPMAQMIGLESDIASQKTALDRLKRQEKQNNVLLQFYEDLFAKLPADPTGEQLLNTYVGAINKYFANLSPTDDVRREVYNGQLLVVLGMRSQGLDAPRFTSGPTLPSRMQGPSTMILMFAAAAIAAVIAALIALAYDFIVVAKAARRAEQVLPDVVPPTVTEMPHREPPREARRA
ncbi:hypothetical protein ACPWR0_12470 [Pandoraea pneumonica]|uniref:hypothetical protein n=1 Tax=Pandoraea pneumonica TaxID=2508299 RepID=UPI003CE717FF